MVDLFLVWKILMVILGLALAIWLGIPLLLYPFANHLKFTQKYFCKLGWHCHSNDYEFDYHDGLSSHCRCKWCGYSGLVDSQGNLF